MIYKDHENFLSADYRNPNQQFFNEIMKYNHMHSNHNNEIFETDQDQEIINGLHLATTYANKDITYAGQINDNLVKT